jgi:hypothetical protein
MPVSISVCRVGELAVSPSRSTIGWDAVIAAIAKTIRGDVRALVFSDLILRSLISIRELSAPVLPLGVFIVTLPVREA